MNRDETADSSTYSGIVILFCDLIVDFGLIERVNGQKFFNTQISIAPIRIFLHQSGENISGHLKTSDPLLVIENTSQFDN